MYIFDSFEEWGSHRTCIVDSTVWGWDSWWTNHVRRMFANGNNYRFYVSALFSIRDHWVGFVWSRWMMMRCSWTYMYDVLKGEPFSSTVHALFHMTGVQGVSFWSIIGNHSAQLRFFCLFKFQFLSWMVLKYVWPGAWNRHRLSVCLFGCIVHYIYMKALTYDISLLSQ